LKETLVKGQLGGTNVFDAVEADADGNVSKDKFVALLETIKSSHGAQAPGYVKRIMLWIEWNDPENKRQELQARINSGDLGGPMLAKATQLVEELTAARLAAGEAALEAEWETRLGQAKEAFATLSDDNKLMASSVNLMIKALMSEALPLSPKSKDGTIQLEEWEEWLEKTRRDKGFAAASSFLEALFRSMLGTPEPPAGVVPPLVSGVMHDAARQAHYEIYLPFYAEQLKNPKPKKKPPAQKKAMYV